jgi:hypothetical protein
MQEINTCILALAAKPLPFSQFKDMKKTLLMKVL